MHTGPLSVVLNASNNISCTSECIQAYFLYFWIQSFISPALLNACRCTPCISECIQL
jgi:hypothetical protein